MSNQYIGRDQRRLNLSRSRIEKLIIMRTEDLSESVKELEMIREAENHIADKKWERED